MSKEVMPHSFVTLKLTKHVSSACRMCGRRNEGNEGFIDVVLAIELNPEEQHEPKCREYARGFVMYCTDCYEMLRKAAAEDCKEFVPFYELVYEECVKVDFPPELIVSAHDVFQLWRRKVDKEAWLEKLAADRAEAGNPE
jgi:hypothetical protein